MIINLVLFFIPKRQEIYRLYLIKKRKKLAYMRLNSKTYSEIYNLKSQNHIIGNASVRSNEVLLNLYYFGDEITKDQTIAILNEHIRPSTERQLYCFAETKNHIWDRIGFIIEPSGIIKHTSGTPRISIIVNDSYLK